MTVACCINSECPIRHKCFRYVEHPVYPFVPMKLFKPSSDGSCKKYIPLKKEESK